jgi:putative tryptophan/tyrosine transport system substrate-binding protein
MSSIPQKRGAAVAHEGAIPSDAPFPNCSLQLSIAAHDEPTPLDGADLRARGCRERKVYRIAMISPKTPATEMTELRLPALFGELRRLGYAEGRNLVVERYSGEGRVENYAGMALEVVRRNPDLICVVDGGIALLPIFKAATRTIPIVGLTGFPVQYGIAASLAHPGGNITGVTVEAGARIMSKRLEILCEAIPGTSKVALLATRGYLPAPSVAAVRKAAAEMQVSLIEAGVAAPFDEPEYRHVFMAIAPQGVNAIIVLDEAVNTVNRVPIVELVREHHLAAMYPFREFVDIAYAIDGNEVRRHLAEQIDLVLKGTSPAEIPFYQPTTIKLIINLNAAKALGIALPSSLLARADEVIE